MREQAIGSHQLNRLNRTLKKRKMRKMMLRVVTLVVNKNKKIILI